MKRYTSRGTPAGLLLSPAANQPSIVVTSVGGVPVNPAAVA
jgi:hypothetical protein